MPKVAIFYNKNPQSLSLTTAAYFEAVFQKEGVAFDHYDTKDANKVKAEYDLYFRFDHGDYADDIPERLRPSVFYAIDTHLKKPYRKIKEQAKHFDILFCCHLDGAKKLSKDLKRFVGWVPVACDPAKHVELATKELYDVAFVGRDAVKFERGRLLQAIRENFPRHFIDEAHHDKLHGIYHASKIGFNASVNEDINMRCFEVMASGAMLLTNRLPKKAGMDGLLEEGKHYIAYEGKQDMLNKMKYYLENDAERKAIADAGREHVLTHHTYYHRVQKMMNYIAYQLEGKFNLLRIGI